MAILERSFQILKSVQGLNKRLAAPRETLARLKDEARKASEAGEILKRELADFEKKMVEKIDAAIVESLMEPAHQ